MSELIRLVNHETFLFPPFGRFAIIVGVFCVAWLATRVAGRVAAILIDRGAGAGAVAAETSVMDTLKQRETAISLVETTVRYLFFGLALLFAILVLTGARQVGAIVGAGFLAVVIGFAAQRFLMDVIAGLLMFFERWFRVGDTVRIDPHGGEGVVEGVSLRHTTLRAANGEIVRVNNSTIASVRVTPRGKREVDVELFASDEERGRKLIERAARVVPCGPTHFIRRPRVEETERLDDDLVRVRARAAVAPGREWLAEELLPDLLKEWAGEGDIVHGPVVSSVDESAARRYARATYAGSGTRREPHPPPRPKLSGRMRHAAERLPGRR